MLRTYASSRSALRFRRSSARRHIEPVAVDALLAMAGPMAAESSDAGSVTSRRAVLEAMGLRVKIDRTRPGPGLDPGISRNSLAVNITAQTLLGLGVRRGRWHESRRFPLLSWQHTRSQLANALRADPDADVTGLLGCLDLRT